MPNEDQSGQAREHVDPNTLTPHPYALERFPLSPETDDDELVHSARTVGITRPLTITGTDCASGPDIVLNGNRRRRAAILAGVRVPVDRRDNLDAANERHLALVENLNDALGRTYTERERAILEHDLATEYRKGQGHRSDVASGNGSPSARPKGETRDLVAVETGQSRTSVEDRDMIFFAPESPKVLQDAVNAGRVSRSAGAQLVREAKKLVAAALATPAPPRASVVAEVQRTSLELKVRQLLNPRPIIRASEPREIDVEKSTAGVEVVFRGMQLRLTDAGSRVRLAYLGRAPKGEGDPQYPGPFVWPDRPWQTPISGTNWVHAIHHAIETFPDDLRAALRTFPVERLDALECSRCGSSRLTMRGACPACEPERNSLPIVDLPGERFRICIAISDPAGTERQRASVTHWPTSRDLGTGEKWRRGAVRVDDRLSVLGVGSDEVFHSLGQLESDVRETIVSCMKPLHALKLIETSRRRWWSRADGTAVFGWVDPTWVSLGEKG